METLLLMLKIIHVTNAILQCQIALLAQILQYVNSLFIT